MNYSERLVRAKVQSARAANEHHFENYHVAFLELIEEIRMLRDEIDTLKERKPQYGWETKKKENDNI